jgi:hypothetical protein
MRKLPRLGILVCLMSASAWHSSFATVPMPDPDDGAVRAGSFTSKYFNLSYPLPPRWAEAIAGPAPSRSGYYVLSTLKPTDDSGETILIAAQDMFFAAKPFADANAMADEVGRAMSHIDGMTIDRPPSEGRIAGRNFSRLDFSGVGLYRSTLITEIRCHLVSFNLTARSRERIAALVLSLDRLGSAGDGVAGRVDPSCTSGYASAEHLLTRVDPTAIGPTFAPVPVRIVIGADGSVNHVHVIRASPGQRDSIESALGRWKFRPFETDSRAAEIETGLMMEFKPTGAIKYSVGNPITPNRPTYGSR